MLKDWMRPEINMKVDVFEVASVFKPNSLMVEIGSYSGESTELFCMSGRVKTLYAVDPWQNGYDDKDEASYIRSMDDVEKMFDERTERFKDIVIKQKMTSKAASVLFTDRTVDCVYIDGLHTCEGVMNDINLWLPKLKLDGIIAGHDFYMDGVRKAVEAMIKPPVYVCQGTSWVAKMVNQIKFVVT